GSVRLYDLDTAEQIAVFGSGSPRTVTAFAPDDRTIAAGGDDGTVRFYDTRTGKPAGQPVRAGGRGSYGVFDPTSASRLFTVNDTGEVLEWNRQNVDRPRLTGPPMKMPHPSGPLM